MGITSRQGSFCPDQRRRGHWSNTAVRGTERACARSPHARFFFPQRKAVPLTPAPQDKALLALLEALRSQGYSFVTPTPATHARVLARPDMRQARDLRDVFGWSLPFALDLLPVDLRRIVEDEELAEPAGDGALRSKVRVSTLDETLFAHSPYPTVQEDAVFFGPDSYRFANLIAAELARSPDRQISTALDIGTGAGVGAIVIKQRRPEARVLATDVNSAALRFATVNAAAAGVAIESIESAAIPLPGRPIDLVVANPPYIIDPDSRAYRDGGDLHGAQVSIDMVDRALPRLAERGTLILYTGSAIVRGEDALHARLQTMADDYRRNLRYVTLDPDVFGEELEKAIYRDVERIALVAAILN